MSNLLKIALQGAFTNFKRIFFAADRVTDMELRKQISTLSVEVDDRVDEKACIGCSGCANVCPTNAIEMKNGSYPAALFYLGHTYLKQSNIPEDEYYNKALACFKQAKDLGHKYAARRLEIMDNEK